MNKTNFAKWKYSEITTATDHQWIQDVNVT